MQIETFQLERIQSLYENEVELNLTESGVHPYTPRELFTTEQLDQLLDTRLTYGYTNGLPELRRAVAALYPNANENNILITNGSSEANFIAHWTMLEPGDEIAMMLPNYMQIWGIARSLGAVVKPSHLQESQDWGLNLEELCAAVTPKTRVIVICNPNNPTGAVLSQTDMQHIVDLADSVGAWIYSDEVYRGVELEGPETQSFYGMYDRVICAGGLSKAYALPGLRIGWLVGPHEVIERAWSTSDYTTITASIPGNWMAIWALEPEKRWQILNRNRAILRQNLAELQQWIDAHPGLFRFIPPKAGGMAFMGYHLDINSSELSNRLREEKSVFVVAGDCYGMDRYIRIGIGPETEYLLAGLKRMDDALKKWM